MLQDEHQAGQVGFRVCGSWWCMCVRGWEEVLLGFRPFSVATIPQLEQVFVRTLFFLSFACPLFYSSTTPLDSITCAACPLCLRSSLSHIHTLIRTHTHSHSHPQPWLLGV